jgi:hypothetical protein
LNVVVHEGVLDCDVFQPFGPGEDGLVHDCDGGLIVIVDLNGSLNLEAEGR